MEDLLTTGELFLDQGLLADAQETLDQAARLLAEQSPLLPETMEIGVRLALDFYDLGQKFRERGDLEGAIVSWKKTLRHLPNRERRAREVVLHNIGNIYFNLHNHREAIPYYEDSLKQHRAHLEPDDALVTLLALEESYAAEGRTRESANTRARARAIIDSPATHLLLKNPMTVDERRRYASLIHRMGRAHEREDEFAKAREMYQLTLTLVHRDDEATVYAIIVHDLGDVARALDHLDEAREHYREAAEIRHLGENKRELLVTLLGLGEVEFILEAYDDAARVADEAVSVIETDPDLLQPTTVARLRMLQVHLALKRGDTNEAITLLEWILSGVTGIFGVDERQIMVVYHLLMHTYQQVGATAKARETRVKIVHQLRETTDADLLIEESLLLLDDNLIREARLVIERARSIVTARPANEETPLYIRSVAGVYHTIGQMLAQSEQYAEALTHYEEALALIDAEAYPQLTGAITYDIGEVQRELGQMDEARRSYHVAATAQRRGDQRRDLITTLLALGAVQVRLSDFTGALATAEEAAHEIDLLKGGMDPDDIRDRVRLHLLTGRGLLGQQRAEEAIKAIEAARADLATLRRVGPDELLLVQRILAEAYEQGGRLAEAAELRSAAGITTDITLDAHEILGAGNVERIALLATAFQREGQFDRARAALDHARSVLADRLDPQQARLIATGYIHLGHALEMAHEYADALGDYQHALALIDAEAEPQRAGAIQHDMGDVALAMHDRAAAQAHYHDAVTTRRRADQPRELIASLIALAETNALLEENDAARGYAQEALRAAQLLEIPLPPGMTTRIHRVLAEVALAKGETEAALPHLERLVTLTPLIDEVETSEIVRVMAQLAQAYLTQGMHQRAIHTLRMARPYLDTLARESENFDDLVRVGVAYQTLKQLGHARAALFRALAYAGKTIATPQRDLLVNAMIDLARAFRADEQPGNALETLQEARTLVDAQAAPERASAIVHEIGEVYVDLRDLTQARVAFAEAIDIRRRLHDHAEDLLAILIALAEVDVALNDREAAIATVEECTQLTHRLTQPLSEPLAERLRVLRERIERDDDLGNTSSPGILPAFLGMSYPFELSSSHRESAAATVEPPTRSDTGATLPAVTPAPTAIAVLEPPMPTSEVPSAPLPSRPGSLKRAAIISFAIVIAIGLGLGALVLFHVISLR